MGLRKILIRLTAVVAVFFLVAIVSLVTLFKIENVKVEGNTRVSEEEIKQEISLDKAHGNTVLLWLLNRNNHHPSNELISSINLHFDFPGNVYVKVLEQTMVACIEFEGGYVYFNGRGTVISQESDIQQGIPLVSGASVTHAKPGIRIGATDDDAMNDLIEVSSLLNSYGIVVDRIERSDSASITAYKGKLVIQLGRNTSMDEKISELYNLRDKIDKLEGTLHLENYDAAKDTIVFSLKDGTKEKKKIKNTEETESETEAEYSDSQNYGGYTNYESGNGYSSDNSYSDSDNNSYSDYDNNNYSDYNNNDYSDYNNNDYSSDNNNDYSEDGSTANNGGYTEGGSDNNSDYSSDNSGYDNEESGEYNQGGGEYSGDNYSNTDQSEGTGTEDNSSSEDYSDENNTNDEY